jgi:hypothetical protein
LCLHHVLGERLLDVTSVLQPLIPNFKEIWVVEPKRKCVFDGFPLSNPLTILIYIFIERGVIFGVLSISWEQLGGFFRFY